MTPKSGLLGLVIHAEKREYHLSAKWALNQATGRKDLSAEGFELSDRNRFPTAVLAQRLVDLGQVAGLIAAHEAGLSSPSGEAEAPC